MIFQFLAFDKKNTLIPGIYSLHFVVIRDKQKPMKVNHKQRMQALRHLSHSYHLQTIVVVGIFLALSDNLLLTYSIAADSMTSSSTSL